MNTKRRAVYEYALIFIMAILTTFNYQLFIINNNFAPAGISGILTMIQYKTGFSLGYMTLIVNIPLAAVAYFFLNRDFAMKSFFFVLCDGISYLIFEKIDLSRFAYDAGGIDTVLPVLTAGIISGFIYGMVFRVNGSTGGVDIVAKLIDEKFPGFDFVWIIFSLNVVVAAISYFVYGETGADGRMIYNFKPVALSILYSFLSSRLGTTILHGGKSALKVEIITEDATEISKEILEKLHRGVTVCDVRGAYSNLGKKMLICIISKHQLIELQQIIVGYEKTFSYVSNINEVVGNFRTDTSYFPFSKQKRQ